MTNVHKRTNCSLTRIWLLHCTKRVHKTVTNKTNFTKNNALLSKLFSYLLSTLVSSPATTQNNTSCASLQYKAKNMYVLVLFLLTEEGLTDVENNRQNEQDTYEYCTNLIPLITHTITLPRSAPKCYWAGTSEWAILPHHLSAAGL